MPPIPTDVIAVLRAFLSRIARLRTQLSLGTALRSGGPVPDALETAHFSTLPTGA